MDTCCNWWRQMCTSCAYTKLKFQAGCVFTIFVKRCLSANEWDKTLRLQWSRDKVYSFCTEQQCSVVYCTLEMELSLFYKFGVWSFTRSFSRHVSLHALLPQNRCVLMRMMCDVRNAVFWEHRIHLRWNTFIDELWTLSFDFNRSQSWRLLPIFVNCSWCTAIEI